MEDPATRFVRSPATKLKRVGETTAVYVRAHRALHVLNPTARLLFECLDRPASVTELSARLAELTGTAPETVRDDLIEVLPEFVRRGVVDRVE